MKKLASDLAACIPQLRRGEVWCRKCGAHDYVDSAWCLRQGWPVCCGETMTIDSPDERRARNVGDDRE